MPTWAPGDEIIASKLNLTSVFSEDTTNATTTLATGLFEDSSRVLQVQMTAPASGRIEAILAVRSDNSVGNNTLSDLLITGSTSGVIFSPSSTTAVQWASTNSAGPFTAARQVSCTAGELVTIKAQHRVNAASTGNLRYRSITAKGLVA
jgi:hypothetical protein